MSTVKNTAFSHIRYPKLRTYVPIVQRGATKRETVQPQHKMEYAVMGTGPIIILIFTTERISLEVRIVVVTIKCTTGAVRRELQLSKNKNGEWVM
jgi:hypothetical protein